MNPQLNPFAHHPELREQIADPLQSFFRTFTTAKLGRIARERGLPLNWWYSDDQREAMRTRTLSECRNQDLWVFAYGSLMWDPALRFAEVRRARVPEYARRFILKDIYGGRGTDHAPGLMAALDRGKGCDGLAFRIAKENLEEETEVLWRREQVGPAYTATFVDAVVSGEGLRELTFVADHDANLIDDGLTRDEQIRYIATGTGFMGSSIDYLRGIDQKLAALGIHDGEVTDLLRGAEAYNDSQ
jgi:cation transport protein ChaC